MSADHADLPAPSMAAHLPHTGPMRWIAHIARIKDTTAERYTAEVAIASTHPFVVDGTLMPTALLEYMAQAAAAGAASREALAGRHVRSGVLAAVQAFRVLHPVHAGDVLRITVRRERTFGALSLVAAEIHTGSRLIADARLTFHTQFE